MKYEKIYQEDGSYLIRQTRDDGRTRLVDENYHGYAEAVASGEVVPEIAYVAPKESKPVAEPEHIEPTTVEKLEKTDAELIVLAARMIEDIANERNAAGKFVHNDVLSKISQRKDLRSEL